MGSFMFYLSLETVYKLICIAKKSVRNLCWLTTYMHSVSCPFGGKTVNKNRFSDTGSCWNGMEWKIVCSM